MGCDIHIYAEVRNKQTGEWEKVGQIFTNTYYIPDEDQKDREWNQPLDDEPYQGRNYDLFAILANVRNGYGFAGIETGHGFVPICAPRGLPSDVTEEVEEKSEQWGIDGHSHSWLTLKELLDYDWDGQTTTQYGVLKPAEYRKYRDSGEPPESYCGGVFGGGTAMCTNEEMDDLISKYDDEQLGSCDNPPNGKHYYTQVEWEETYREAAGESFFKYTLPELHALGDPEDVRIVFWFDN